MLFNKVQNRFCSQSQHILFQKGQKYKKQVSASTLQSLTEKRLWRIYPEHWGHWEFLGWRLHYIVTVTVTVWHWCAPSKKFGQWLSFELLNWFLFILADSELISSNSMPVTDWQPIFKLMWSSGHWQSGTGLGKTNTLLWDKSHLWNIETYDFS